MTCGHFSTQVLIFKFFCKAGNDGIRLLAIKFIEVMILLYTPDPNVPSDPPKEAGDGMTHS